MRVERFSLFFPPTIFSVRRGETEYALGALPLGGYVKITGMSPEEIGTLEPEVAQARLLQPGAVEAHRGDPGGTRREPADRVRALLGDPRVGQPHRRLHPRKPEPFDPDRRIQRLGRGRSRKARPPQAALRPGDQILSVDGRRASVKSVVAVVSADRCTGAQVNGCTGGHARTPRGRAVPGTISRCRCTRATAKPWGGC